MTKSIQLPLLNFDSFGSTGLTSASNGIQVNVSGTYLIEANVCIVHSSAQAAAKLPQISAVSTLIGRNYTAGNTSFNNVLKQQTTTVNLDHSINGGSATAGVIDGAPNWNISMSTIANLNAGEVITLWAANFGYSRNTDNAPSNIGIAGTSVNGSSLATPMTPAWPLTNTTAPQTQTNLMLVLLK
jgi:hypothetical protein